MDFELTEEQRQIRSTVADFAEREIKPNAGVWDREGIFPRNVVEQIGAKVKLIYALFWRKQAPCV